MKTKSEIFKAAHKLAKTFEGNYRACFALALVEVNNLPVKIKKGNKGYKMAQKLANKLTEVASYQRWNQNSLYNMYFDDFYQFIFAIKETETFAAKIAETVDENCQLNGYNIAKISSKQAWILACAAIENNINF